MANLNLSESAGLMANEKEELYPLPSAVEAHQSPPPTHSSDAVSDQPISTQNGHHINLTKSHFIHYLSIFTCICCCWPLGLAALYYSNKVDKKWDKRNYEGAGQYEIYAKIFNVFGITIGTLTALTYLGLIIWASVGGSVHTRYRY